MSVVSMDYSMRYSPVLPLEARYVFSANSRDNIPSEDFNAVLVASMGRRTELLRVASVEYQRKALFDLSCMFYLVFGLGIIILPKVGLAFNSWRKGLTRRDY